MMLSLSRILCKRSQWLSQKWGDLLLQHLKKTQKEKRDLENTEESPLFETDDALMEAYRKLQSEVKRLKRVLAKSITLHDITSRKLEQCEKKKFSRESKEVLKKVIPYTQSK